MTRLLQYSFVAILVSVSFAAPNPAVNRIDAPVHKPHSTRIGPETASSSSTTSKFTLEPREPAVNRIDAVRVNVHHETPSSATHNHSFRTLVSTTLGPHITLDPRDPAVNRIDAIGVNVNHKTTTHSRTTKSTISSLSSSSRPHITLNPRDPAVNRIDAVGNGMADEVLASVSGGTPVTLAINDIEQLEAAA